MTHPDSSNSLPEIPHPFIPRRNPDADNYYLTIEFIPTDSNDLLDPSVASVSGTEYHTSDGRVAFTDDTGYDVIEFTQSSYRYTVSVPTPTFHDPSVYLEEATQKLQDSLPHMDETPCTIRLYLSGKNALELVDDSGLLEFLTESLNATSTCTDSLSDETNAFALIRPENATSIHI